MFVTDANSMKTFRRLLIACFLCTACTVIIIHFSDFLVSRSNAFLRKVNWTESVKFLTKGEPEVARVPEPSCEPSHQIVFVKTHKTASTTANTIIQRYGYVNNLTFALPKRGGKFSFTALFRQNMVDYPQPDDSNNTTMKPVTYDVIANHGRFNKPEMDAVISNAHYLTIIRDPVAKCESTFGYYNMARSLGLQKEKNPFEAFFEDPDKYFDLKPFMYFQVKNGMMYSFGLNHIDHNNKTKVERKIQEIDETFDLVLISEFFDESLLLMKKALCWDEDDILYLPKGIRSSALRYDIDPKLREKVLQWNSADVQLYDYFNRTFWEKVKAYGPSFDTDLRHFRERQRALLTDCIDPGLAVRNRDRREQFMALRSNASDFCVLLNQRVDFFVNKIRERQNAR